MKAKFRRLSVMLALFTGVPAVLAQLGIAPAGNQTVLYWPTTATNYVLQSTTNLASPNWVTATDAVPVVAVAVANTSPARFFRLYNTNTPAGTVFIPAGSFTMGDTLDGESDAVPTNIYVSAFFMDTNPVSYGQWQTIYNWAVTNGYNFDNAGAGKAANHPVQTVDWYDCVKWSNARSQQAGLTPVYYTDAEMTQVYTNGDTDAVYPNWSANGFRLPTEAEWEKAARGGSGGLRYPWGNTISESQANYQGNTSSFSYDLGPNGYNAVGVSSGYPYTTPVGYFTPNGFGLYDMTGNIFEWCWDWYGIPYGQPTTNDPTGPATGLEYRRMIRGGFWASYAQNCKVSWRDDLNAPSTANVAIGFRCVRAH
ncbi:MAG: formylglycine-generating enzyme family protein [Limisphaerales bacterium]